MSAAQTVTIHSAAIARLTARDGMSDAPSINRETQSPVQTYRTDDLEWRQYREYMRGFTLGLLADNEGIR